MSGGPRSPTEERAAMFPAVHLSAPPPPPLRVVTLHQDALCEILAREVLEGSLRGAASNLEVERTSGALESLAAPADSKRALFAAARADLLVLSIRADLRWPPAFRQWLETWAARHRGPDGALVAILVRRASNHAQDAGPRPAAKSADYLRHVARRAGADYFEQEFEVRAVSWRAAPLAADARAARA